MTSSSPGLCPWNQASFRGICVMPPTLETLISAVSLLRLSSAHFQTLREDFFFNTIPISLQMDLLVEQDASSLEMMKNLPLVESWFFYLLAEYLLLSTAPCLHLQTVNWSQNYELLRSCAGPYCMHIYSRNICYLHGPKNVGNAKNYSPFSKMYTLSSFSSPLPELLLFSYLT